jgi:hypothetical protein
MAVRAIFLRHSLVTFFARVFVLTWRSRFQCSPGRSS